MNDCTNQQQADAWMLVWDALRRGNPNFIDGSRTGQDNAVREIERLYEDRAAYFRTLGERDSARRERDGESTNKNLALRELDKERERHTETLKVLEKERATSDQLARELMKARNELLKGAFGVTAPVAYNESQRHQQNVRRAVHEYARVGAPRSHMTRVAEAVYYLLDRDQLQTAAIKRLSERLDALEPNKKQAADQCAQGFSPPLAPWEIQQPTQGFNPR